MKKVLVAIDGSTNALNAVEYVNYLFNDDNDTEITLMHIYPSVPLIYLEEEHDPQVEKQFESWVHNKELTAKEYIAAAEKILKRGGINQDRIHINCSRQVVGVARDIVRKADAGRFDAIVVGSWEAEVYVEKWAELLLGGCVGSSLGAVFVD